jgi:hypothetical protein
MGGEEITPARIIFEKSDQKWSSRRTQKTLSDMTRTRGRRPQLDEIRDSSIDHDIQTGKNIR